MSLTVISPMKIPAITGTIKRRFLINFRVEPEVLQKVLPAPFSPKLQSGFGVAGICLIRLENIRPKISPVSCGVSSENAAHRIAVQWENESGDTQSGVFIHRRDTDSLLTHLVGGTVFPGVHQRASFSVTQDKQRFDFSMSSLDGQVNVEFSGNVCNDFPSNSCFSSLEHASSFFEGGSLGYSPSKRQSVYDGLMLQTNDWKVQPFEIIDVASSYFDDTNSFPAGSIKFDHALLMQDIPHEWHAAEDLCCKEAI